MTLLTIFTLEFQGYLIFPNKHLSIPAHMQANSNMFVLCQWVYNEAIQTEQVFMKFVAADFTAFNCWIDIFSKRHACGCSVSTNNLVT